MVNKRPSSRLVSTSWFKPLLLLCAPVYLLWHKNLSFTHSHIDGVALNSLLSPLVTVQNILAGAIFGPYQGLLLACLLTTVGSTMCYLLSQAFGKHYIAGLFPDKVSMLQRKVGVWFSTWSQEYSGNFGLFAVRWRRTRTRCSSFCSSWDSSPWAPTGFWTWQPPSSTSPSLSSSAQFSSVIRTRSCAKVPHWAFSHLFRSRFSSSGLLPYNFICVQTGVMLSEVSSLDDLFSSQRLLQLLGIACMALVPGALIHRFSQTRLNLDTQSSNGEISVKKVQWLGTSSLLDSSGGDLKFYFVRTKGVSLNGANHCDTSCIELWM